MRIGTASAPRLLTAAAACVVTLGCAAGIAMSTPQASYADELSASGSVEANALATHDSCTWQQVGTKWYCYWDDDNTALTGWHNLTIDDDPVIYRFYFTSDGMALTGWQQDASEDVWFYFDDHGRMQTGWQKIKSVWYYFAENGQMTTGWSKADTTSTWYYFGSNGKMRTGWQDISGKHYIFSSGGAMQKNKWQSSIWYWDTSSSKWVKGSTKYWYYLGSSGAMATSWLKIGGKWYFFHPDTCRMFTEWGQIDGTYYYFGTNGVMQSSKWLKDSTFYATHWYYLKASGAAATGWLKISGSWYLFGVPTSQSFASPSYMVTGLVTYEGSTYRFSSSGVYLGKA